MSYNDVVLLMMAMVVLQQKAGYTLGNKSYKMYPLFQTPEGSV